MKREQGAWGRKGGARCSCLQGLQRSQHSWLGAAELQWVPHLTWSVCRVINAEKSQFNEDQAACCQISVRRREPGLEEDEEWLILCSTQVLPPGRLCSPCCQPFAATQGQRFRKQDCSISPTFPCAETLPWMCLGDLCTLWPANM